MPHSTHARPRTHEVPCLVFSVDANGILTHISGPGLDAVGREAPDYTGLPMADVCAAWPDTVEAYREARAGAVVERVVWWEGAQWSTWYVPVYEGSRVVRVHGFAVRVHDAEAWPLYHVDPMVAPTFERAGVLRPYVPVTAPSHRVGRPPYLRLVD